MRSLLAIVACIFCGLLVGYPFARPLVGTFGKLAEVQTARR